MTDIATATPAAVDMSVGQPTTNGKSSADKKSKPEKPEKPNEVSYKESLAKAEKEHKEAMDRLNAIKAKLDSAGPNKDKQSELREELKTIREKQSAFKSSRGNTKDKLDNLEAQLKSRIQEQKTARSRVAYRSVDDIDREIQRLQKQVDSGTMKLVDEKKALSEISNLTKIKKNFAGFEQSEKGIADVKAQISELKNTLNNSEQKALSERYSTITTELDSMKSSQNGLRDERTTLHAAQQKTFQAIRAIKDEYYGALNAWRDWEREAYRQRQERQRSEREAYAKEKRKKVAESKLEEASTPAFTDEIMTAEGLIRYFDPNTPAEQKVLRGPSGFAAEAQRKIDSSNIKGTVLSKKEDREETYFMGGSGGKKGKKGRKGANAEAPASEKFNLPLGVIEELGKVNVEQPSSQSDIPAIIEKLKGKVEEWKKSQADQTKKNIAKAQAEIDKLEAEAAAEADAAPSGRSRDSAKKISQKNAGINGNASAEQEQKQEIDAAADAAEDLKKASIEDNAS